MKVLINATLVTKSPAGIGRWSYELSKRLIENRSIEWVVVCPYPDVFKSQLMNTQVEFVVSPEKGAKRIYFELIESGKVLSKYKPNIYLNMNYGIPLLRPKGIKFIATIHDLCPFVVPETFGFISRLYKRWAIKRTVNHVDHIIADSISTKKDVMNLLNIFSGKISVVYGGVNYNFFARKRELKKLEAGEFILAVGTLEPRKNLRRLIEAYDAYIFEKFPEIDLYLAGNIGWKMDGFYDWLCSLKSRNSIKLIGRVSDEELVGLYQHAKVFVYPSLYEGFGLPPLEAMAAGCPVVVSNSSSLPEVIGDAGLYVDALSVEDIGKTISQLLSKNIETEFVERAKSRVKNFTWDRTCESALSLIQEVYAS